MVSQCDHRRMPGRRRGRSERGSPVTAETAAGTVEIVPDPGHAAGRLVLIGGLESAYVDLRDPTNLRLDYVRRLADALDALVPRGEAVEIVHLGGGGFTLPRHIAATRPAARQEVYELDPAIVALARHHLRLRPSPALRVRTGDARAFLQRRAPASADLVVGDAFTGTDVPAHLATVEFAREVARVLRPGGRYLLNTIDTPPLAWARAQAATLAAVFGHVVAFGGREVVRRGRAGNVLFLAGGAPSALARRLNGGPHPSEVVDARAFAGGARPLHDRDGNRPRG
jgi:SAM-dependent methyltransferase